MAAIRAHHAQLARTLVDRTVTVQDSVDRLTVARDGQRAALVSFCEQELLPHAAAEEETLYRAAADLPETRLLARAMIAQHGQLREAVSGLAQARTPAEIAGHTAALRVMFLTHLDAENDLLLPALVDAGVDVASLLEGMHEILGTGRQPEAAAPGTGCTCGGHHDSMGEPGATAELIDGELDVRRLVPAERHRQIFATFRALPEGSAFVLVNDHDPKPLYYQFAAEHPGEFVWEYLESGPQTWRVRIGRPRAGDQCA
ncbi:hypothetical protein TH66_09870 [Carbonactinospora thermoautotrophica]|uniref:Hemerythrin HHE cation binding domain protein n=1 Tax=Carbonactinospora thermoautotrophica TaxID=1469144 RepID=A0A132N2E0_9ACTN|nr:hypothetical protein TH66_09870 [Carbonactinospora thermoautotrophica]KWX08385.1 hypothetical protein TR74_15235 [Carbonactinospora thermoautotrophica]